MSKKDKKAIRVVIDKGIQEEFRKGMEHLDSIFLQWRELKDKHQENYVELYGAIKTFDKKIAQRYDYLGGSSYLHTVILQFYEHLIDASDLETLSPELQTYITDTVEKLRK